MFAVQPGGWDVGDEELASVGVWAGIRHGKDAGLGVFEGLVDLVWETVTGAAASGAGGIAALDHEVFDDSVEGDAVIEASLGEVQEVGGGDGDFGGENRAFDGPAGGFEDDSNVFHWRGSLAAPWGEGNLRVTEGADRGYPAGLCRKCSSSPRWPPSWWVRF